MNNIHQICKEESTRIDFLNRVLKTESCWEWIGTVTCHGYGHFKKNGKIYRAHRVSFILFNGEIPLGMLVCHKCDNRKCVNPDHLWLGTSKDNALDMSAKGRGVGNKIKHYSGDENNKTKLTSDKIAEIKRLSTYFSQRKLARIFGVCQGSIWNALRR